MIATQAARVHDLGSVELVEAWMHARRHVAGLEPFTKRARGARLDNGVRLVLDRHRHTDVILVLTNDDSVWTIDGHHRERRTRLRWREGHAVSLDSPAP